MEKLITIGNFIFCPLHQIPLLGIECQKCEYVSIIEENHFCICELEEECQTPAEEFDIKELINIFVDLLYSGKTSLKREELKKILE
ncbi:MAG: hypothetical protein PHC92_07815 [Syntrophomonadaceae bacterium]|nr:hypothetical protein [Syntrophomonadaceae bacterium]MDD3024045.1 hypothetical protein [Syntrophomonadaceae bacterium]